MESFKPRLQFKFILAIFWLFFTLSFAIWWMILGLNQIEQIQSLLQGSTPTLDGQRRMMIWEGFTWMLLLLAGGVSLIWLLVKESRQSQRLKEFFAAFSHDIKTAITSLRLQAESLKEDLSEQNHPSLNRLVADTVRIHLQLENSLFLAQNQDYKMYIESLSLSKLLKSIRHQWPDIEIDLDQDAVVQADERSLKTVLSNLIHNSVVHGEAQKIEFQVKRAGPGQVHIRFRDNGKGFAGEIALLGRLFHRHNAGSGSGVGLFVAKDLVNKMRGQLEFENRQPGFGGSLYLKGNLL